MALYMYVLWWEGRLFEIPEVYLVLLGIAFLGFLILLLLDAIVSYKTYRRAKITANLEARARLLWVSRVHVKRALMKFILMAGVLAATVILFQISH